MYFQAALDLNFKDFVRKCDGNIIYQIITTGNKRNDIIRHITSGDAFYLVLSHQIKANAGQGHFVLFLKEITCLITRMLATDWTEKVKYSHILIIY